MANGEYVYFMDADDMLVTGALDKIVPILRSNKYDLIINQYITSHNQEMVNEIKGTGKIKIMESGWEFMETEFCACAVWRVIVRRKTIIQAHVKFREKIKIFEDAIFIIELLTKCRAVAYK